MKLGIEVEGRFKGLKTLFFNIDEKINLNIFNNPSFIQIYISKIKTKFQNEKLINDLLNKFFITIETDDLSDIPKYIKNKVSIILNIENENFFNLKETDQIKFNKNNNVYCISKESMFKSFPEDFLKDEII